MASQESIWVERGTTFSRCKQAPIKVEHRNIEINSNTFVSCPFDSEEQNLDYDTRITQVYSSLID